MVYIVIGFCFAICYVVQPVLLKISGQIFTSLKAQIVDFLLRVCIRRYIYQTCRVFTLNFIFVIHLNDDSV